MVCLWGSAAWAVSSKSLPSLPSVDKVLGEALVQCKSHDHLLARGCQGALADRPTKITMRNKGVPPKETGMLSPKERREQSMSVHSLLCLRFFLYKMGVIISTLQDSDVLM